MMNPDNCLGLVGNVVVSKLWLCPFFYCAEVFLTPTAMKELLCSPEMIAFVLHSLFLWTITLDMSIFYKLLMLSL